MLISTVSCHLSCFQSTKYLLQYFWITVGGEHSCVLMLIYRARVARSSMGNQWPVTERCCC
ncbi:hypothetical protein BDQ12DRAFT_92151 [Crucibulum laeve]|uniref:Uncharacterized protein n=1 Tax=Crucibulum laeve TaxID=68775 RepID=A0A5C3LG64_9AGAR|nr:hypothetical protein BDQ12DRAFT_92151 [Crucibulum laeve]